MQNTLENKIKYFAQHIGCVLRVGDLLTRLDHIRTGSDTPFGYITNKGERLWTAEGSIVLKNMEDLKVPEAIELCKTIGLAKAEKIYEDPNCFVLTDDSYRIDFYNNGVITMHKRKMPYWKDMDTLYTGIRNLGYAVGDTRRPIHNGWLIIETEPRKDRDHG